MAELVRIDEKMTDALLAVQRYVKFASGVEASQEEIANTLKSYFILNEIGNQIKFLRKKSDAPNPEQEVVLREPFWNLNLMPGCTKNNLARAGLFRSCIREAIITTRNFVKKASGDVPTTEEIAKSLKCSFILSEIKNQIDWQRKNPDKANRGGLGA